MGLIYSCGIWFYEQGIRVASHFNSKAKLWCIGREDIFSRIARAIVPDEPIVWIHVASLGEFEQGRPIIEELKVSHPELRIMLTFFSPSGYEVRKSYPMADYIFYLPSDRPRNVRRFLDIVKPRAVIFVKYEFWLNYLRELRRREIPTYLISASFRPRSIFFMPWGIGWRRALRGYKHLFVQNERSQELLLKLGCHNVTVAGDTRFDRVVALAKESKSNPSIEQFISNKPLFIAGSTWEEDEVLLRELIAQHPDIRFIIAPHEIGEERVARLKASLRSAVLYTEFIKNENSTEAQVLILNTMGMLGSIYRYARWAYIGGGFGRGIHNTLEAATYGLPIAFGPNYKKFNEAIGLIECGAACSVKSARELSTWFTLLKSDDVARQRASDASRSYTAQNCGATKLIIEALDNSL